MAELFAIRNEDDLDRAIALIRSGDWSPDLEARFVDWPRFEITIRGEDFDGGVPTRIMPALMEVQRTIRRAYARGTYGTERRLTREELKQTELVVRLEPGSTTFWSELAPVLNVALKNMTGTETVIVILGVAAIAATAYVWKARINADTERRNIDYRTTLSDAETERLQTLADLAKDNVRVAATVADSRAAQDELLKRLEDDDRLLIGGEEVVNGAIARQIVRKERQERVADRLDSDFVILSVESGAVRDGFRIRVRDTVSDDELRVSIPAGTLTSEQVEALQSGEWEKRSLRLEINTERVGERLLRATLISAGLKRADGG